MERLCISRDNYTGVLNLVRQTLRPVSYGSDWATSRARAVSNASGLLMPDGRIRLAGVFSTDFTWCALTVPTNPSDLTTAQPDPEQILPAIY